MNTFSRALAPSLRISYLVLPPTLLDRYHQRLGFYSSTVPALEQYTLASFLSEGRFEQHLSRARNLYRALRDQVLEALEACGLAGLAKISVADAGLHFLVRLETERGDQELTQLARARGIRLSFLSEFCASPGPEHQHFLVISYPGIQMERLPQTLRELAALLH